MNEPIRPKPMRPAFRMFAILLGLGLAFLALLSPTARGAGLEDLARLKDYASRRESSANPDLAKNGDARPIEPGATLTLGELAGPGEITHLWCTVASADPFYARSLILRIYWDGLEKPSVEAPLGDFFAVGHGARADVNSAPVTVSSRGRAMNAWWRMPFARSARVTLTNESATERVGSFYYYLDWRKLEKAPEDSGYFHAQYRQAHPATPGDYTLLETTGRGHYVGVAYSIHQMESGWFGEGDDRFYIDGEAEPSLRGTGSEDYFGDAWGFRQFSYPYIGVPLWEGYMAGDRVTAYRWHIADPVAFTKSLKVTIEHRGSIFNDLGMATGSFIERADWLSSVAFWYQSPPRGLEEGIATAAERLAPYRILNPKDLEIRAEPPGGLAKSKDGLTYLGRAEGAKLELDFEIAEKGRWQVNAMMMFGLIGARWQPTLDGKPVGPELDFCEEGMDPDWVRFDLHDLDPGKHTLGFENKGASPRHRTKTPMVFGLGMQRLILLRLEDMAGYRTGKPEGK